MTDYDSKRLAVEAARDQMWKEILGDDRVLRDLTRLAEQGPDGSPRDAELVRMFLSMLLGDALLMRDQA